MPLTCHIKSKVIEQFQVPLNFHSFINGRFNFLLYLDPQVTPSLMYDVTGEPRKESVKTPRSITGSRPNALPNKQVSNFVMKYN